MTTPTEQNMTDTRALADDECGLCFRDILGRPEKCPHTAEERRNYEAEIRAIRICDLVSKNANTLPARQLWRLIVLIMDEHASTENAELKRQLDAFRGALSLTREYLRGDLLEGAVVGDPTIQPPGAEMGLGRYLDAILARPSDTGKE